jgi:hypothetical protein
LGFGQVVFVAVDLEAPPLREWQSRPRLVARLLEQNATPQDEAIQDIGQVAHEGYDDLVGQLRAALDQFHGVTRVSFTAVATLTVLYILLIGPADYFLLQRVLRRMEWTWVTFPSLVLLFCLLAFLLVPVFKGQRLRINQVELVDIDAQTLLVRGTMWAHVYSPRTDTYDLAYRPGAAAWQTDGTWLSWQGLPGAGLGGMQNRSTAELFSRPYAMAISSRDGSSASLVDMPIQVASSKTLTARWWGEARQPVRSQLQIDRRHNRLHGSFTNPLPVALTDCVLSHGTWTYRLDRQFSPGETINVRDMRERSLTMHLTRRTLENVTIPWDLAGTDVPRILEMMMFHRAAGGPSYTSLTHQHQGFTDLSGHLDLGLAILTGWTSEPAGQLVRNDNSLSADYDRQWTFYRFVLPVADE